MIGEEFGVDRESVRRALKRRGLLESRTNSEGLLMLANFGTVSKIPVATKEKAAKMYAFGLTPIEVAQKLGISAPTVLKAVRANGGKVKSQPEANKKLHLYPLEAAEYYRFYEAGYSCTQIGEMYAVTAGKVRRLLKVNGYKLRSLSEARKLVHNPKNLKPHAILPTPPNPLSDKPKKLKHAKPNNWLEKLTKEAIETINSLN